MWHMFISYLFILIVKNTTVNEFKSTNSNCQIDKWIQIGKLAKTERNKQTKSYTYEDWVSKLTCKIQFFVPFNGHQKLYIRAAL